MSAKREEMVYVYSGVNVYSGLRRWCNPQLVAPISRAHSDGWWHPTVELYITDGRGNVLFQQRDPCKEILPGVWAAPVGGHVSAGDSPADTVVREAHEELGLQISPDDFQPLTVVRVSTMVDAWGRRHRIINHIFIMKRQDLSPAQLVLEEGAVAAVQWIPMDQLMGDLRNGKAYRYASYGSRRKTCSIYGRICRALQKL